MPGIFFSNDVKIYYYKGGKCIFVPRAYFGKETGKKDSPIVLPIKCDELKVGNSIKRGWTKDLVVANSEAGTPYIRPASQTSGEGSINEEKTTVIIIPQYVTGRIHKLRNQESGAYLFKGINPAKEKEQITDGAIICLENPGDIVRVFKRGGVPEEKDWFFVFLPDGMIAEAEGVDEVMNLYNSINFPVPFETIIGAAGKVRGHIVSTGYVSTSYRLIEDNWAPI